MPLEIKNKISPEDISSLLTENYSDSMREFYEMQSNFLRSRYKIHKNIESSNIIISFLRNVHLSIIRQREINLDHDISLDNFLINLNNIETPSQKVISVVKTTGIPKETVRRKLKKLLHKEYLFNNKNKEYYWKLTPKRKDFFFDLMSNDINIISKFVSSFTKYLNLNLNQKIIAHEIKLQFSFYFFHFLNCQLTWLRMWQTKINDLDLIFIAMQALIPTLKYEDQNINVKEVGIQNLHTLVGKISQKYNTSNSSISASSIAEISGIPRPTCIRKLDKLVQLGLLIREVKTKRYYVNQLTTDRTKSITRKENVIFTVESFSKFLSIVISALIRKEK